MSKVDKKSLKLYKIYPSYFCCIFNISHKKRKKVVKLGKSNLIFMGKISISRFFNKTSFFFKFFHFFWIFSDLFFFFKSVLVYFQIISLSEIKSYDFFDFAILTLFEWILSTWIINCYFSSALEAYIIEDMRDLLASSSHADDL